MVTVRAPAALVAPAKALLEQVPATRQFAPRSVLAAPEPPPPKAQEPNPTVFAAR